MQPQPAIVWHFFACFSVHAGWPLVSRQKVGFLDRDMERIAEWDVAPSEKFFAHHHPPYHRLTSWDDCSGLVCEVRLWVGPVAGSGILCGSPACRDECPLERVLAAALRTDRSQRNCLSWGKKGSRGVTTDKCAHLPCDSPPFWCLFCW